MTPFYGSPGINGWRSGCFSLIDGFPENVKTLIVSKDLLHMMPFCFLVTFGGFFFCVCANDTMIYIGFKREEYVVSTATCR